MINIYALSIPLNHLLCKNRLQYIQNFDKLEMMEETVNQRVRQVRDALELSQRKFSTLLSLSSGYIAGIEAEVRAVNGRLIKLIAAEFGVSEEWLKTGKGEMFKSPKVDEKSAKLVSLFNGLTPKYKEALFGIIDILRILKDKE
jgi:transcriptional regulator with XRE-family HTH domain